MLAFEPEALKTRLAMLPQQHRAAFAIACAIRSRARRVVPLDEDTEALRERVLYLACGGHAGKDLDEALQALLASPSIDDDDVAAAAFALECARDGIVMPAFWAAQRAYDQADAIAQWEAPHITDSVVRERALLSHPAVQDELEAQQEHLRRLESGRA
jgi:hypothetical protein